MRTTIRTTLAAVAAAGLIAVTGASALAGHGRGRGGEGRGGGHRGFARLADKLDLSEAQRAQAKVILEEQREKASPNREQRQAKRQQLKALLDTPAPDYAAIGKLTHELHQMRGEGRGNRNAVKARLRTILTPEQQQKLDDMKKERGHRGRGKHQRQQSNQ